MLKLLPLKFYLIKCGTQFVITLTITSLYLSKCLFLFVYVFLLSQEPPIMNLVTNPSFLRWEYHREGV
jgi:hypothetical protein